MKKILASVIRVVGELLFLYGLLGWAYGVLAQFTHLEWLPGSLSHLTPELRLDTFTILCFIASAVGFFMWRLTEELTNSSHRSRT